MGKVLTFNHANHHTLPATTLDGLAPAVRNRLRQWEMSSDKNEQSFLELEQQLVNEFHNALRGVLAEALEAADPSGDEVLYEGQSHRRVLTESKSYMTSAGPVQVRRGLFRASGATHSVAAMERVTGIIDGFWTPRAASNALWMVTQMVPKKAAQALERLQGMAPSKASLDRLPKVLSQRWESERAVHEAALIAAHSIPQGTSTLAVSLDGVYAPIEGDEDHVEKRRRKHQQGLSARGPDAFREVGCASIGFYGSSVGDEPPQLLGVLRFGRAPEYKKLGVKAMLEAELRAIIEQHSSLQVVYLSDGAPDHWELFESLGIAGHFVLDFYHAAEHLNAALGAAYGEASTKARRRFADLRHVLLEEHGAVARIRRALQRLLRVSNLSSHRRRIIERAVRYFNLHADRMHYSQMRSLNLPIGSGIMEASCKTLVAQRLKLSGQRWSTSGAQAILTPRGWDQSERFDEAFALLAATYRGNVTVISPVTASG